MEQINIAKIGMNSDVRQKNLQKGEYSYALNASIEDFTGDGISVQNTASNILQTSLDGFFVIGKVNLVELNRTVYFLTNNTTSKIIEVKNLDYDDDSIDKEGSSCCGCGESSSLIEPVPLEETTQTPYQVQRDILTSSCLNLNINHPIDIEYRLTSKGVNLYFTDNFNPIRFFYLDLVNDNLVLQDRFKVVTGYDSNNCNVPIYSSNLDCNKIKLNPNFSVPCVETFTNTIGGNLREGVYQAMVCYSDNLGNPLTTYFPATATSSLKRLDIKVATNNETDNAITFKISNLDATNLYEYYNIVIIKTIDNFTSFDLAATLPISKTTYTYTGNGEYKKLTSNDVFFERPIYSNAKSISKSNGYLFMGNMKEHPKLNLQRAINRIPLYWQTKSVNEDIYSKAIQSGTFRTYMRDEVYSAGIVFEMTDDNDTIVFPLVGRDKNYYQSTYNINVDQIINNNDVITYQDCETFTLNKRWQLYNTAQVIGQPHQESKDCKDSNIWEYGDFSYWESTENYPNIPEIWGDLCGKPIRHFKFPDSLVTHIHNNKGTGNVNFNVTNKVYPIGFRLNHQDVIDALNWAVSNNLITIEQKNRIKSYRLVRSNRIGNKSITCKGLLYNMWSYSKDNAVNYYSNYPYNDLRPDFFIAPSSSTYNGGNNSEPTTNVYNNTNRYTFHSPEVHFTNSNLGSILKLEAEETGQSEGFFSECREQARQKLLSTVSYTLALSFGVAAAISALEEKECRTYTVKADSFVQDKGSVTGDTPVGIVSGGGGVLTAAGGTISTNTTTVSNHNFTANGTGKAVVKNTFEGNDPDLGNINTSNPNSTYGNSGNPAFFSTFDPRNSKIDFWNLTSKSEKLKVSEYTGTTCKGTTYQVLNSNSGLGGIGGLLSGILGSITGTTVNGIIYRTIIGLREMQVMLDLFETLVPYKNNSIQYNSVGKYVAYNDLSNNGNKLRYLGSKEYLTPTKLITTDNTRINNWNRESTVYLKHLGSSLPAPSFVDNSRNTLDNIQMPYGSLNVNFYKNISSFYVSLKNYFPNQYGTIYELDYLETDGCSLPLNTSFNTPKTYFGGDIFITRFALKRKMPFFVQTRFRQLDGADVKYEDLGNVGYPNYYFNTKEPLFERLEDVSIGDIFSNFGTFLSNKLLGVPESRMDAKTSKFFYQNGYTHLYSYGIPYFLVESEVNCDFRHGENDKESDFYPRQKDISNWLQEDTVSIKEDNTYFYNKTYSKQNTESPLFTYTPSYIKSISPENNNHPQRIIYSDRNLLNTLDGWLIFRANNYHDVNRYSGELISIDGLEQDKILVRTENNTQIFNAYDTLKGGSLDIQVGNDGIFTTSPTEFAVTDLGYMGTQHRSILKTEFGHIWVDSKRGSVFLLNNGGGGVDEISKNGMRNWFKQNLPFQILKDFKNINIDNAFKGIGISMVFDKRYSKIYITKLDYKKLKNNIEFINNKFYIGEQEVFLWDKTNFCNKSWTISYNFLTKSWTSFHSFKPNFYNDFINDFNSGINDFVNNKCTIWGHNLTNKSYQVYYGKKFPFTIDVPSETFKDDLLLKSVSFTNDVIRYQNLYDYVYKNNVTFNKLIIYNDFKNSGILNLNSVDRDSLNYFDKYPIVKKDSVDVEATSINNNWRVNDFFDVSSCIENNQPTWLTTCSADGRILNNKNINYSKPEFSKERISGKNFNLQLTNDLYTNYKFIFTLTSLDFFNLKK